MKAPASAEVVSIASTIYQDAVEAAEEAGSAPSSDILRFRIAGASMVRITVSTLR